MLKRFILFFILIASLIVSAEEFQVSVDQEITFKEVPLQVLNIGTKGSIQVKISGQNFVITKSRPLEVAGLQITFLDSYFDTDKESMFARIKIIQIEECIINDDCVFDSCTKGLCIARKCISATKTPGCTLNDQCLPEGSLESLNQVLSYCSPDNTWHERKIYKTDCINNYECLSNYCFENKCDNLFLFNKKEENMAPAWILIIFGIIIGLGSLSFIVAPKLSKVIASNFFKVCSIYFFRIAGFIGLLIAILLIIWALI